MAIRNQSWYNLNSTRDYPLADTASAISDNGDRLPQDIITDLRIRWPDLLGSYAFVGSAAVTKGAVTVTILASTDLANSADSFTPIASISIPLSDFDPDQQYPLEAMYPGTFGYITFGSVTSVPWSGTFSSPSQSLLASRAGRPYASLPVSSLGRLYDAVALTGVINLSGEKPLEVTKGTRLVGGIYRDVIVVRLIEDTQAIDDNTITTSAYEEFVGKCGKRPESLNCGSPAPLQSINAVGPDCDGVICINFKGCAVVGKNTDDCGIVLDCGIGLSETCNPPWIPTMAGILPSEKFPSMPPIPPDPEPTPTPDVSISEGIVTSITLPHCDAFQATRYYPDGWAENFLVQSGGWTFVNDNSPEELCGLFVPGRWKMTDSCSDSASDSESVSCSIHIPERLADTGYSYSTEKSLSVGTQNISLFVSDAQTLFRKYQTDMKMLSGIAGMKHNGGILVNHKLTSSGTRTFFLLELDHDDAEFRLVYFNGLTYVSLASQELPGLSLNDWYNLELRISPASTLTGVLFQGILTGVTDPSLSVTMSYTGSWAAYRDDSELSGFHTNRAYTRFSYWRVSEYTP